MKHRFLKLLTISLLFFGFNQAWGQGTSYTSVSATGAWNTSRWNNSTDGPTYTANYTANNNVIFTSGSYSFAGMGATINVGNITVNSGANVTFTSVSNTFATDGNVRTITVASGSTFDFNGQSLSTAAGTGFIKSGDGVYGTGAGNFTGGFTLNAGTVIARGTTGMGSGGSNTLTLNGGVLASNATRDFANTRFPGGIVIGGNVQFGELSTVVSLASSTADLSFANNVSLGSSTRTFTLGNNGTQTFSGVISNTSGGITFDANSGTSGRFDITNTANTFTGNININGGEVRFTADGSLGNSANDIIIDGGRFGKASDATTVTLATGRDIQVGDGTGTSITSPGSGVLVYNNPITDKTGETGSWAKQGGGTLELGGASTYTGSTSINNGTIRLTTGNNRLPTTTVLNLGQASSSNLGTLDLNGRNQTIAGLNSITGTNTSSNNNTITSSTAATLTINGGGDYGDGSNANSGVITGSISLVKTGSGTLVLADENTYTGTTTVSGGTLRLNRSGGTTIPNASNVTIDGGTLRISTNQTLNNITLTSGTLQVDAGATLTINGTFTGGGTITNNGTIVINAANNFPGATTTITSGFNNLTIRQAVTLNANVTVNGTLDVENGSTLTTGGNLTIASGARIANLSDGSGGTISGNVTVQQFFPARRAFRFVASPVTTSNFISNNWQQQTHITGTGGASNGFDATTLNNNSMFTLNTSTQTWSAIANTNATNLQQGVGYRLFIRGDRTIDLSNNSATPTSVTLSATGSLTTGSITYNSSSTPALSTTTNHYTFLGNPYPSSVDWNALSRTDIATTYYTWRAQGGTNGRGAYVNWNATGNVSSDGNINQYIGTYQGFMVQTTGGSPSITFAESNKVSNEQGNQIRGKSDKPNTLRITVFEQDSIFADGMVIYQNNDAQDIYETFDSEKWINPGFSFYSLTADNKKVSIQGFKTLNEDRVIPLGMEKTEKTIYKLEFSEFSNMHLDPILIDNFTKTKIDIKRNPIYEFMVNDNEGSSAIDRFKIVFEKPASTNIKDIVNINSFVVYPNPAVDVLNIQTINHNIADKVKYTLYNHLGASIENGNLLFGSNNRCSINISNLSNGVYFIQLVEPNKGAQTIKFIK